MNSPRCVCGSDMIKRSGPYSEFWGCVKYPECTKTKKYVKIQKQKIIFPEISKTSKEYTNLFRTMLYKQKFPSDVKKRIFEEFQLLEKKRTDLREKLHSIYGRPIGDLPEGPYGKGGGELSGTDPISYKEKGKLEKDIRKIENKQKSLLNNH